MPDCVDVGLGATVARLRVAATVEDSLAKDCPIKAKMIKAKAVLNHPFPHGAEAELFEDIIHLEI